MKLYQSKFARRLFFSVFSRLNLGDIYIRHHYTGDKLFLHSYRHKGYWFHGKNRERETMLLFEKLIEPNNTIIEIGGHIGYISMYFAWLVGPNGHVHVFEPGPNNLPYLQRNLAKYPNISIHTQAVGRENSQLPFYVENLTGQNNTLLQHFDVYEANRSHAYSKEQYDTVIVDVIRLDSFVEEHAVQPDFVKIDVEGAELEVIRGMIGCLETHKPGLMIEFNTPEWEIYETLTRLGYIIFDGQQHVIHSTEQVLHGNIFALHRVEHAKILTNLELTYD